MYQESGIDDAPFRISVNTAAIIGNSISCFVLVVGVFIAQAVPGVHLLYTKRIFPMALKFNDFSVLLLELESTR